MVNPLYDPNTDNAPIADEVQKELNKPLADTSGFAAEDQLLLNQIMQLVEEGKINLYGPSTLLNTGIYDSLDDAAKAKADQNSVHMLGKIREIVGNMKAYNEPTFQVKNLVAALRLNKEALEEHADIFIF